MTDEDRTAAKLQGYNWYIKFTDGEIVMVSIPSSDEDDWYEGVEQYLSGVGDVCGILSDLAVNRNYVKYIRKI